MTLISCKTRIYILKVWHYRKCCTFYNNIYKGCILNNQNFKLLSKTEQTIDYINKKIDKINNQYNVVLPYYKFNKGLPIGNQTSQILAIFYLNDLDHFIKEKLHIKNYLRYMDDFVLIHEDNPYLKYCKEEIVKFLLKEDLALNNKTNIYDIKNGITFLGYKYIFKKNRLLMLIPSHTKRRINSNLTNIDNYNDYLIFGNTNKFRYLKNKIIDIFIKNAIIQI